MKYFSVIRYYILFLLIFLVLPISFADLVGPSYSLTDMNSLNVTLENNNACADFNLGEEEYASLKANPGILALDLYIKFTPNIVSKSYLQFFINDIPVTFKTKVGYKYDEYLKLDSFQEGRYILPLEDFRDQNSLNLRICGFVSGSVYSIELLEGSKIGSFKMPYFGCDSCFKKTLDSYQFLVGDIVKATITLKNIGFDSANVFVRYNYFDVNTEIKMLGGELFYNGIAKENEPINITYSFKSKTDKYFLVPPASMEYEYDGFKFKEISNPLIVNAKNYLDDVECEITTSKLEYSKSESAEIIVSCYNKSSELKQFNLVLTVNGKEILNKNMVVDSKKIKEQKIEYSFDDLEKKSVCGFIKVGTESKDLVCSKFYFSEGIANYTLYILGFVILVLIGIFVYYQFFL